MTAFGRSIRMLLTIIRLTGGAVDAHEAMFLPSESIGKGRD
jgi:hypothetical protein